MITDDHRRQLLAADRTRDIEVIAIIVDTLLAENPDLTPLDVETAFRDGSAQSYLVNGDKLSVVLGMPAWLAALAEAGRTPDENRAALAAYPKE